MKTGLAIQIKNECVVVNYGYFGTGAPAKMLGRDVTLRVVRNIGDREVSKSKGKCSMWLWLPLLGGLLLSVGHTLPGLC